MTDKDKSIQRCALYTRVSTRNQMQVDYNSLETQREKLEAYCNSQESYKVFKVYEDGGISGDTIDRPALKEMLFDIRSGKIDCVLAYKIDRLTRSTRDYYTLTGYFDEYEVRFISITQGIDTSSPTGRLLRNILVNFSQFEREMIADRTRDKMRQRAEKGLWNGGTPPYGYNRENKKLVPEPEEAETVRFIFEFYAMDSSISRLREALHQKVLYTRLGKKWYKTSLSHILHNPLYIGKIRSRGDIFEGQHEPILDEELYYKVQTRLPERTHAKTRIDRIFLLKRLLKCGFCGSWMSPHYTQKKRKDGSINRIPYYRCTKAMHHGNQECVIKSFNANKIENLVIDELYTLSQNKVYLDRSVEELNKGVARTVEPLQYEARNLEKRINEIEKEIERYVIALGQGTISLPRLEQVMHERESDKNLLQSRLDEIQSKINREFTTEFDSDLIRRNLQNLKSAFENLAPKDKAEALQCILKEITMHPDKIVLEIFDLPEFNPGSKNRTTMLPLLDYYRTFGPVVKYLRRAS